VLKATIASTLSLAAALALTGCTGGKEEPATTAAAPAAPAAMPSTLPADHPAAKPSAEVDVAGIAKAEGGKTVAEIYAEKDALANQQVTVRGKVVKSNLGVMNMDWLHVRDGSGAEGSNDLTVTSAAAPAKVGDTVVVTGTVALNKDFGMGYQYPVLIEKADVKIETGAAAP
jgi:lipoprotein-anchoring transpeptidase ErfK/SrfK